MFGSEEEVVIIESSPFDFDREILLPHGIIILGGINALNKSAVLDANITANLTENNIPFWTQGSYYSIGMSTFEPTIGITSNDNLFISSWGNGPAGSTAIVRCSGLITMTSLSDYS